MQFRVWAPSVDRVALVLEGELGTTPRDSLRTVDLIREGEGYFSGHVGWARAGTLYRYRLGEDTTLYPDPGSRFQPDGPHGPSQVIDPGSFRWTDQSWPGIERTGQVIYEMHVSCFTCEGTWRAAELELPELAALGITVVEVMPIAEFPGRFGWGYDGVDLFAPSHLYGRPDDFRSFVDRAHALGLGVILDEVYNHLGPDGNYLRAFSPHYFADRYKTDWGEAINFDGDHSAPVREFFLANAGYWVHEYHLDGLRLDATECIYDRSREHILAAIGRRVRESAGGRQTWLVAENDERLARLVRPLEAGGYGLDAVWNDDFHHSAIVALTGQSGGYYTSYQGTPQELISCAKRGFLYQGQPYRQGKRRGTPTAGIDPSAFVTFLENHDQVANSGLGERLHSLTSPARYRAMTALFLLAPGTPLLFQGQEFAASSPFLFFADHSGELREAIYRGRRRFLAQFPGLALAEIQAASPDPGDPTTFERCKLDLSERERNTETYALHRDLIQLRRSDPVFSNPRTGDVDGAVLGAEAFVLRFCAHQRGDRLLVVNLGQDLSLETTPEPLLAPPEGRRWTTLWSSEDSRYGGLGTPPLGADDTWFLPRAATVVLEPIGSDAAAENPL